LEVKYSIKLSQLNVNVAAVLRYLGYVRVPFEHGVEDYIQSLIEEATGKLDISCGFRWEPDWVCKFEPDAVNFKYGQFEVGTKIVTQLAPSETLAVFIATLGQRFETWSQGFFAIDDPMSGYLSDAIGSVILEAAEDWLEDQIAEYFRSESKHLTNRYKPGYCGWDKTERYKLLDLMSKGFSEISLNPAGVMIPLKSSCGIIGIGAESVRKFYPCEVCEVESCALKSLRNE